MSTDRDLTLVIDFETANHSATSACELGIVAIEYGEITHRENFLIKPPSSLFAFTHIHGITWEKVKDEPTFLEHWEKSLKSWFEETTLLVAHNIGFDLGVLKATAGHYQIKVPNFKTDCTVKLSRYHLGIRPANLAHVSQTLGIPLNHHQALSDATASAYIYLHAKTGRRPWDQDQATLRSVTDPADFY